MLIQLDINPRPATMGLSCFDCLGGSDVACRTDPGPFHGAPFLCERASFHFHYFTGGRAHTGVGAFIRQGARGSRFSRCLPYPLADGAGPSGRLRSILLVGVATGGNGTLGVATGRWTLVKY
jgi:hypothetical protein